MPPYNPWVLDADSLYGGVRPMPNPSRHRLSFSILGLLKGDAEGLPAIAAFVALILLVVLVWRVI